MIKASRLPATLLLQDNFFALNRGTIMEQFVGQELLAYTPADEVRSLRIVPVITSYSCIKSGHHLEAIGSIKKLDGQ